MYMYTWRAICRIRIHSMCYISNTYVHI